ncbi:unnamed protein product [Brachionus calyciflorus]|uniref:Ig-like domain-containing protein n=1 Tax=Brachionus calyciflorus TaxID=104777 RepID=A0A813W470_9BILA|nr:unnamed protein product [Brachionus calyciflorus]
MKFYIEFLLALTIQILVNGLEIEKNSTNSSLVKAIEAETVTLTCPIELTDKNLAEPLNYEIDNETQDYDSIDEDSVRLKRNLLSKRQAPIIVIQWFKDSVKLNKFITIGKYEQDGLVLKVLNVNEQDSGNYTCKLINGLGAISSVLTLQVEKSNLTTPILETTTKQNKINRKKIIVQQRSPSFLNTDKNYKFQKQKGDEVRFNCKATGLPKPDILWFKNGEILSEEDYGITRSKWTLSLKDLRMDDNGNFTCQVFNKYGSINATFELTIFEDSQIFEGLDPMNSTISTGMDAIFTCKVKSQNLPNIKWMKQISKAEYTNYVIQNSNSENLLKDKDLNSEELRNLYVLNSLPSLKLIEKNSKKSEYDDTFLNDLITGNDNLKQDEFNFDLFVPNEIDFGSTTKKIETKNDDSIHYITLSSSPSVIEKFSYNKEKNYYVSQLTIKQANVKDSGIYVCFGATTNGYSYRKSYLKVLPTIRTQPDMNFYPNDLLSKFKKIDYKENLFFNNRPLSTAQTNQVSSASLLTIQSIGLIIIGIPVILIALFALISVCYLKNLDNLKEDDNSVRRCSFLNFFKIFIKSKNENLGIKKSYPGSHALIKNKFDETMDKKLNSFAKNTLSTSASSEHTNTLQCVTTSLGSSMSDSSSETTVAYYATIPLLVDNIASSPPPLPSSQPPTFSPVFSTNYNKYYIQSDEFNQQQILESNLKRTESNPSMAYYKIVDTETIQYNNNNINQNNVCKYQENDQQVASDYKKLDDTNNSSSRFYFQIAPKSTNSNVTSFSSNSFNKRF